MRILALDASTSCTGYAGYDAKEMQFVEVNKIRAAKRKATPTIAKRIEYICTELSHIIFWGYYDVILIEDIYVNKVSSAIPLAMLRGAIQSMVYNLGYEDLLVIESSKMKKAVTGKGNASKEDTYNQIKKIYQSHPIVVEALGDKLMSKNNAQKNEDMADAVCLIHAYLSNPSIAHPA